MGRTPCCDKNGLKKGPWTPEEDQKLIHYIQKHGYGNWRTLPNNAGLQRCGKSCRLRWTNYLRPDIKRGKFSLEEEDAIIQLHSILGNKWSAIAARLPGRTDNEIKNYWNTHIRKRLLRMGIDPVTHILRFDLLDLSSILCNSLFYNNNTSPPSQINMSRLIGLQPLQNTLNPMLQNTQIQTHVPTSTTMTSTYTSATTTDTITGIWDPLYDEAQLIEPNFEQYTTNIPNLDAQNLDQWQSNGLTMLEGLINVQPTNSQHYGLHQFFMDPFGSNNSTLQSSISGNQSFLSYAPSVMSTQSSSPTSLNSSSSSTAYVNSSRTEDERENNNYCSDMIKSEMPDLDVNHFLLVQTN